MKGFAKALIAGSIVALMLAATETLAGYPRPSSASGAFFSSAFLLYLIVSTPAAWMFATVLPTNGLNLWLPFLVGTLRLTGPLVALSSLGEPLAPALAIFGLLAILLVRRGTEAGQRTPPFLFGLTVGVVLPILFARVAQATPLSGFLGPEKAFMFGATAGLLAFVLLRAFVARWPKAGPLFLVGPVVSLALWSRAASTPVSRERAPLTAARADRPDIVLVVLDTVRAQALASYGSEHNTMPGLETFARGATTFRRAWTDASWTLPAHASLFSGVRPTRHRYDSGFDPFERSSPDLFLAPRLRRAGYATAAVAANFGVFGREDPLLRGFEHVDAEPLRPFAFRPWFFDLISAFPHAPGSAATPPDSRGLRCARPGWWIAPSISGPGPRAGPGFCS